VSKHKITAVQPHSIAQELDLAPGDFLLSINGRPVQDVLDYRFAVQEDVLLLEVEKPDGEIWELDIEKDPVEDLGLDFETGLMDKPRSCRNRCLFCFIDQLPRKMRPSLYFKDDDVRLSFLTGNYVTLTNCTPAEVERIAGYHLSPLHISVQAAKPALRQKLLNTPEADGLFAHLRRFKAAGITMHFQIVLCKGLNDGPALDESIRALLELHPAAASLSVVPVGLTRHREGLHPLAPFTPAEAQKLLAQVEKWQAHCRQRYGHSFVFCADEWYLKAGRPLPDYAHYEDFPQLENGVGMWTLFAQEFAEALAEAPVASGAGTKKIGLVTGRAAMALIQRLAADFSRAHPWAQLSVHAVENHFFGPDITVSGLLTGQDILAQAGPSAQAAGCEMLILPGNAFRAESTDLLDDMRLEDLQKALQMPVYAGECDGGRFVAQLRNFCPSSKP